MKEKYFAFVRMFVFAFSAIGIIIVVAGVISDLSKSEVLPSEIASNPEVHFADFKEFKNYVAPVEIKISAAELKKEQDKFYSAFFKNSQTIFSNISKYSLAFNQGALNQEDFDEYLFKLLSKYDIDLRIAYLEQLSLESGALLKYADEVNQDRNKKTILWNEFLDWFSKDFNNQLEVEDEEKVVTENLFLSTEILVIALLLIIIMLLSRYESQASKEEKTEEELSTEVQEDEANEEEKEK